MEIVFFVVLMKLSNGDWDKVIIPDDLTYECVGGDLHRNNKPIEYVFECERIVHKIEDECEDCFDGMEFDL